jgi:hypothetical protein
VCIIPVIVAILLWKYQFILLSGENDTVKFGAKKDENTVLMYVEKYGDLYDDLRFYERMALMYNPIFMYRRLIFSFMVVIL